MNKLYTSLLVLLTLAAAAVYLPLRLLQPFEPQTEGEVLEALRIE